MARAISRDTAEALLSLSAAIVGQMEGARSPTGRWLAIRLTSAKAVVWAVYERRCPYRSLGNAMYGSDYPLFEGDPTWLDPASRERSRTHDVVERVQFIAALRLNIPQAEAAA